ncbi:unnamed protein product, partial [Symbiodinium necroappetens]
RDAAFMERLRTLAREALAWRFLEDRQTIGDEAWPMTEVVSPVSIFDLPSSIFTCRSHTGSTAMVPGTAEPHPKKTRQAVNYTVVTNRGCKLGASTKRWLRQYRAQRKAFSKSPLETVASVDLATESPADPPLRHCQMDCLEACAKGARTLELACGTGKTRIIQELARSVLGRVLVTVPSRVLLEQFATAFPTFCKVGMGYNKNINFSSRGFVSVADSVHRLQNISFSNIFIDEAHHPIPLGMPCGRETYKFSATHDETADFQYTMSQAIEDGVLCDYDLTVPVTSKGDPFLCLAQLLGSQAGRFRRVLAYCNSVREAQRFQQLLKSLGMAAWHMNANTPLRVRQDILAAFTGPLQKPVHILVTVQVLGEGVNIPNADTCMFVEPRRSYTSIIQAIGRVLRHSLTKPLAHIVLPSVAVMIDHTSSSPQSVISQQPAHENRNLNKRNESLQSSAGHARTSRVPEQQSRQQHQKDEQDWLHSRPAGRAGCIAAVRDLTHTADCGPSCARDFGGSSDKGGQSTPQVLESQQASCPSERQGQGPAPLRKPGTAPLKTEMMAGRAQADPSKRIQKRVRPAMRMMSDERYDTQLERFMVVLGEADSRLLAQPLGARLWIADARTIKGETNLASIAKDVLPDLEVCLRQADHWQLRLEAVEDFVAENGRLPVQSSKKLQEKALGLWLCNVGYRVRQQHVDPGRVQKLLNCTSDLLRTRVREWLGQDVTFLKRCKMLKDFVQKHDRLPNSTARSTSHADLERRLQNFLAGIKLGSTHITPSRLKTLKELHPLVTSRIESWEGSADGIGVRSNYWHERRIQLMRFVEQAQRMPRVSVLKERPLNDWIGTQRRRFLLLPEVLQKQLLNNSVVASYIAQYLTTPVFRTDAA